MVTKEQTAGGELSGSSLRTLGLTISSLSVALALLIVFVLPGNAYASGFEILILSGLFIVGLVTALVGKIMLGRTRRP